MQEIKITNTSKTVLPFTNSSSSTSSSSTTATTSNVLLIREKTHSLFSKIRSKLSVKAVLGILLAVVATVLMVLSCVSGSFVQRGFIKIMHFVQEINVFVGSIFFILLDTLTVILVLPGTPGNLAAGYIFGTFIGSLVSILGITFGAIAAFLLGRTLMRSWGLQKMEEFPKFRAIDKAIADNAFLLIFLMRFSPLMPFAICCYMLGATRVSWVTYSLASLFGLAVPTAAYCHLGSLMKDLSSMWEKGGEGNKNNSVTYVAVFAAATVLLVVLITYITKKALDNAIKKSEENENSDKKELTDGDVKDVELDCLDDVPAANVGSDDAVKDKSGFVLSSIIVDNDYKK